MSVAPRGWKAVRLPRPHLRILVWDSYKQNLETLT